MNEIDSKTIAAIKSIPATTRTWLGGFRFDCAQDDEKFDIEVKWAEEIVTDSRSKEENDPKWGIVRTGYNQGLTINEIPVNFKLPKAPPVPPPVPKELDKVDQVVENERKLSEKDALFRDTLIVLLGHIEVHTPKIDDLVKKLKEIS